jgi:hypothetical protein
LVETLNQTGDLSGFVVKLRSKFRSAVWMFQHCHNFRLLKQNSIPELTKPGLSRVA